MKCYHDIHCSTDELVGWSLLLFRVSEYTR